MSSSRRPVVAAVVGTGVFALCAVPLFWTAGENADIEAENAKLREVLDLLSQRRPQLQLLADARRICEAAIEFWHGVDEGFRGRKAIDPDFIEHHEGDRAQ